MDTQPVLVTTIPGFDYVYLKSNNSRFIPSMNMNLPILALKFLSIYVFRRSK